MNNKNQEKQTKVALLIFEGFELWNKWKMRKPAIIDKGVVSVYRQMGSSRGTVLALGKCASSVWGECSGL